MADLAIDRDHRLALSQGDLQLTEGSQAIAQRLRLRLGLHRGECFVDTRIGIPYSQILGYKPHESAVRAIVRQQILSDPEVVEILRGPSFELDSATRTLTVRFAARTTLGEDVTIEQALSVTL